MHPDGYAAANIAQPALVWPLLTSAGGGAPPAVRVGCTALSADDVFSFSYPSARGALGTCAWRVRLWGGGRPEASSEGAVRPRVVVVQQSGALLPLPFAQAVCAMPDGRRVLMAARYPSGWLTWLVPTDAWGASADAQGASLTASCLGAARSGDFCAVRVCATHAARRALAPSSAPAAAGIAHVGMTAIGFGFGAPPPAASECALAMCVEHA